MGVRMDVDSRKLARIMDREQRGAAQRGARQTQKRVRRNMVPRTDTGAMSRSVKIKKQASGWYKIYSDLHYTIYQEKGIGPVTPVKAKALRFKPKGSGKFVFAQRTRGFSGGHFFRNAMRALSIRDFLP